MHNNGGKPVPVDHLGGVNVRRDDTHGMIHCNPQTGYSFKYNYNPFLLNSKASFLPLLLRQRSAFLFQLQAAQPKGKRTKTRTSQSEWEKITGTKLCSR